MTAKDFSREGTKEMPGTLRCSRYELSKKGSKKEGRRTCFFRGGAPRFHQAAEGANAVKGRK